jgi:mediator of RNA polymerase II transcription subunit 31
MEEVDSAKVMQGLASLSDDRRLVIECEFVQNLANVMYLRYLAQNRFLSNSRFLDFLKYLRYWKRPEYAKLLMFPHCLAFLDALIENEAFRRELQQPQFAEFAHAQQGSHWQRPPNF